MNKHSYDEGTELTSEQWQYLLERTKKMTKEQIENIFTYHAPKGTQQERYIALREKAKELALAINEHCPESREKSIAFTKLQECVQMANASIAINE